MKANLLVSIYNARTKHIGQLTPQVVIDTITDIISPISYISYDNKLKIIEKTLEDSKDVKFPTAERYRNLIINLIATYTNIEMDKDAFDILSENKMLDIILSTFKSEYQICENLMQMCLMDLERSG